MKKTQGMRMLDQRGIGYTATEYDAARGFHSGAEAAALLGVAADHVYKTLVALREPASGKPLLVVIPVDEELDLKTAAQALGAKRLRMATQREAERLTGLKVGGISALAVLPGRFEVVVDARALTLETMHVSAGERGMDVALNPRDLVAVTGASIVDGMTIAR